MNHTLSQVTKHLKTHVAAVVHAIQRIGTLTSQIKHSLRVNVDQLQLCRRQGVLHRIRVFELSQTNSQLVTLRNAIVGIELLYYTREIVHKHKRPAIGDSCFCP